MAVYLYFKISIFIKNGRKRCVYQINTLTILLLLNSMNWKLILQMNQKIFIIYSPFLNQSFFYKNILPAISSWVMVACLLFFSLLFQVFVQNICISCLFIVKYLHSSFAIVFVKVTSEMSSSGFCFTSHHDPFSTPTYFGV